MEAKTGLVDLHFHSVFSDGSEKLSSIIMEAKTRGFVGLALTDHNNGEGVTEFMSRCRGTGITAFEGVEIYATFPQEESFSWDSKYCGPAPDFTILGRKLNWQIFKEAYQFPLMEYWRTIWLPETLDKLRGTRLEVPVLSDAEIVEQLKNFGVPRVLHDVPKDLRNWSRLLEIAQSFDPKLTMKDIAKTPIRWANRYLYAIGTAAYVLRGPKNFGVKEAVELAKDMGGVLFAAHPGGEYANWSDWHLNYFIACGGKGVEVWQYFHTNKQVRFFLELAIRYNLLVSGGSDWHGVNGRPTLGCWDRPNVQTPNWVVARLLEQLP